MMTLRPADLGQSLWPFRLTSGTPWASSFVIQSIRVGLIQALTVYTSGRQPLDLTMTATLATIPLDTILCISAFIANPLDALSLSQVRRPPDLGL